MIHLEFEKLTENLRSDAANGPIRNQCLRSTMLTSSHDFPIWQSILLERIALFRFLGPSFPFFTPS